MLFAFGVKEIKLTVISSNERAVNLYKKLEFIKEDIISSWFVKESNYL
jgi:ribosomal protein S18 acetylase RimI-like enzyme